MIMSYYLPQGVIMFDVSNCVTHGRYNLIYSREKNCDLLSIAVYTSSQPPDHHTTTATAHQTYEGQIDYTVYEQKSDVLLRIYDIPIYLKAVNAPYMQAVRRLLPESLLSRIYPYGVDNGVDTSGVVRGKWHPLTSDDVETITLRLVLDLPSE